MIGKLFSKTINTVETISVEGIKAGVKKEEIDAMVLDHLTRVDMASSRIAQINANDPSFFMRGWRPALGWACVAGFTYQVLIEPFTILIFNVPPLDPALLTPTIAAMIGTYGIRAWEKSKGNGSNK